MIALQFSESWNIVRRINDTALQRDEGRDLVTIHHPTKDRVYAENRYWSFFSDPKDSLHSFGDILTAGIDIGESRKVLSNDDDMGAQSWGSHIIVGAVDPHPTGSVTPVPSNVHLAESETFVPASISEGSTNAPKRMSVSNKTPSEEIVEVEPVKVDSAAVLVTALHDNANEFASVGQTKRIDHHIVRIVFNLNQIMEVPYPPREAQDDPKQTVKVSIQRNRYYHSRDTLTDTLATILDGNDAKVEALLAHDGVTERFRPAVQVALVNWRHWFAALSQLVSGETRYNRQNEGPQMCLVIRKYRQPMVACQRVIYRRYRNSQSGLVLSNFKF